jgi:uncharacterized membrane protein
MNKMKTSNVVFIGITIIFFVYGIVTAPLNGNLYSFGASVGESLVISLLLGLVISWVYKKVTHEDKAKVILGPASI